MLGSMRFKNYIWPHNPHNFEIHYERRVCKMKLPFSGFVVQDLGDCARVFSGEGEFCGENAYEEFRKLASVFAQGGVGVLVHPLWPSVNVVFESLSLTQEPIENYVRYSFSFVEYSSGSGETQTSDEVIQSTEKASYTVRENESLGELASGMGVSADKLMKLNPSIKNPNVLGVGQVIRTE